ncbi:uncharacterized protein LOC34623858 [Cyclospora cayetanensis]|uniref:Uncharacterized protein LOC34623858 n=1 Tax=Cyclospora cayetanensis TaxID=88456 RepID=A0A6P6S347_9EIME|nr:uncharacterized protein LOC34623858 [Cyclospora cayetanensis]
MRLIPLFVYGSDEPELPVPRSQTLLPPPGGEMPAGSGCPSGPKEGRNCYSIVSLRISPCRVVAACGCSDGYLRLAAVPNASGAHPEACTLAAASSPAPAAVAVTGSGWVTRRKLSEGKQIAPVTCVAWEPSAAPQLFSEEGKALGYSLLLLATTGAGQIVQCLVTAIPSAAEPPITPAAPEPPPPAKETPLPNDHPTRGIVPFFVDEVIPVRLLKSSPGPEAPAVPPTPESPPAAFVPSVHYTIAEVWREEIPQEQLLCCAFSSRGDAFAAAGRGRTVYVFDTATKHLIHSLSRASPENPLLARTLRAAVAGGNAPTTTTTQAVGVSARAQQQQDPLALSSPPNLTNATAGLRPTAPERTAVQRVPRAGGTAATVARGGAPHALGAPPAPRAAAPAGGAGAASAVRKPQPATASTSQTSPGAAAAPVAVAPHGPGLSTANPATTQSSGVTSQRAPAAVPRHPLALCVGSSEHHAHGNRIVQVLFLPEDKDFVKSNRKQQVPKLLTKHTIISCGVDSTIQLWSTERQLSVGGTAECSPLGESVVLLSPSAALVASHRDERQLMILKLPEFEVQQVLDANMACICGPSGPSPEAPRLLPTPLGDGDGNNTLISKAPLDEGVLTTQFYCCRVAVLPEGRVAACCGGNRHQIRTYFLPSGLEQACTGGGGAASSSNSSNTCPCSRNAFHLFGLETVQHPPLTLDVCCASPVPPRPKKQQQPQQQPQQQAAAVHLQPAAIAMAPQVQHSIISSFAVRPASKPPVEEQQQQEEEELPEEDVSSAAVSGILMAAVQGQVAVYGITGGPSDLSQEFSRLRHQVWQRRCEEALDAAAAARILQAHAAAAADPGAAATDRKGGGGLHERDDEEKEDDRGAPTALQGLSCV